MMHMDLSTPYGPNPVAGAGLSRDGDTWSLNATLDNLSNVDTTGVGAGAFLQKSAGDWMGFDLFAAANTWVLKQTFDPVGGIDLAGGPLLLEGGTTPLIRSSGSGNLDCSVAVGKNFSFFVDGTADVIIAANTITLDQGAVDWILDWSSAAVLKISWAGLGILIAPGGINPVTDNAGTLGATILGFSDLFLADDGAVNFRGSLTHEVGSDAANEVQLRAPNIVNLVVGSTDVFRCDAAGVQILGSTTAPANAGEVHYLTDDKALKFAVAHGAAGFMGLVAQTSAAEAEIGASTTSEVDFATTKAFGADDLTAGYVIPIRFAGVMDSAATSTVTVRIELHGAGETTLLTFTTASGNVSADVWYLEAVVHVATIGATGTVAASGRLFAKSVLLISTTASVTIDTTEALTLAVSVQFDKSNAGNGMTAHTASFQAGMV